MSPKGPSGVTGRCDAPDRRPVHSGPGRHVTWLPRQVAPPERPSSSSCPALPGGRAWVSSMPVNPCGTRFFVRFLLVHRMAACRPHVALACPHVATLRPQVVHRSCGPLVGRRAQATLGRRSYAGRMTTPATAVRGRFSGLLGPSDRDPVPVATSAERRSLRWETVLVLGVSLGSSAIYAVLSIIEKLTRPVPLAQQTTAMNQSATPGRPWLDLAYQLAGIVLPLVAVALALHLAQPGMPPGPRRACRALRRPRSQRARA